MDRLEAKALLYVYRTGHQLLSKRTLRNKAEIHTENTEILTRK